MRPGNTAAVGLSVLICWFTLGSAARLTSQAGLFQNVITAEASDPMLFPDEGVDKHRKPPEIPSKLECEADSNSRLSVSFAPYGSVADVVEIEIAQAAESYQLPFMSYTVAASAGKGSIAVPEGSFTVIARAHLAGYAEDMARGTWSNFSEPVHCTAAPAAEVRGDGYFCCGPGPGQCSELTDPSGQCSGATYGPPGGYPSEGMCVSSCFKGTEAGGPFAQPSQPPPAKKNTKWLEVYRISEMWNMSPDFLDNHDSGDVNGETVFLSACNVGCIYMNFSAPTPITRYCVEMEDVRLHNITTQWPVDGSKDKPITSRFADYVSCNPADWEGSNSSRRVDYDCPSDNAYDRMIGHEPQSQLLHDCTYGERTRPAPGTRRTDAALEAMSGAASGRQLHRKGWSCHVSEESARNSQRYIGMMPTPLPTDWYFEDPGVYPGTHEFGLWYSHPAATRCRFGESVGAGGCTWQRSPRAYMVYTSDFLAQGWNGTSAFHGPQEISETLHNRDVLANAFKALNMPPCGAED